MKKYGFLSSLLSCLYILLLLATFAIGFWFGSSVMTDYRAEVLREDAGLIDQSLRLYAQTREIPAYPPDLKDIAVARKQKHWMLAKINRILRHGDYDESADIKSRFTYTPILDAERHYTMYRLEVTLPNGQNYISPGSTRQDG